MNKKGFTLLELLIVIAILAVLATAVVLVLNPAEYLRQARDTQRTNDINAIKSAIDLAITSSATDLITADTVICTMETVSGITNMAFALSGSIYGNYPACLPSTFLMSTSSSTATNGTGWVRINFSSLPSGSPIAKLPLDPNNQAYFYAAKASSDTYRLAAKLESQKYIPLMTSDGGPNNNFFEAGTDMTSTSTPF